MALSDAVRQVIKLLPAARRIFFGVGLGLAAAVMFIRGITQTDPTGYFLDMALGWIATAGAVVMFLKGLWSLLVIRQQERPPNKALADETHGKARFEDPDDAIRRMSGR